MPLGHELRPSYCPTNKWHALIPRLLHSCAASVSPPDGSILPFTSQLLFAFCNAACGWLAKTVRSQLSCVIFISISKILPITLLQILRFPTDLVCYRSITFTINLLPLFTIGPIVLASPLSVRQCLAHSFIWQFNSVSSKWSKVHHFLARKHDPSAVTNVRVAVDTQTILEPDVALPEESALVSGVHGPRQVLQPVDRILER